MKILAPVERTTRIASTVEDLADAWAFVMTHIDEVGPDPRIEIVPVWSRDFDEVVDDDEPWPRHFSVVVSGTVKDGGTE